ncbi:hypothetical protein BJX64DRAFT_285506 [Aspergillus heterothallicus]
MENRQVTREKYSELKLQASPAYLTSEPDNGTYGVYTDSTALVATRLASNKTTFYVIRHGDLASKDTISYRLTIPTSIGGINLVYSTAKVFSWKKSSVKSILVLYKGEE